MNIAFCLENRNEYSSGRFNELLDEYGSINSETELDIIRLEPEEFDSRFVVRGPLSFYHLVQEEQENNKSFLVRVFDLTTKLV